MNRQPNELVRRLTPVIGVTIGVALSVLIGILMDHPWVQENILGIHKVEEDHE